MKGPTIMEPMATDKEAVPKTGPSCSRPITSMMMMLKRLMVAPMPIPNTAMAAISPSTDFRRGKAGTERENLIYGHETKIKEDV